MSLESIGKLRNEAKSYAFAKKGYGTRERLLDYADEIEREIAEKYLLLPVDANGETIHVGDWMTDGDSERVVVGVTDDDFWAHDLKYSGFCSHEASLYRHVKPRTVEDVVLEAIGYGTTLDSPGDYDESVVSKLAAELRMKEGCDD